MNIKKNPALICVKDTSSASEIAMKLQKKPSIELSTTVETEINIPFITSDASGPKHLLMKMTRATLESMAKEYVDRSIEITKRAMAASPY